MIIKFLLILAAFLIAYVMVNAKDWWDDINKD